MNCYETLFVVKPTLTEEEIKTQIEKVKKVLEKEGAELLATDDMGMRKLAYPVEKNLRGYYTVLFYKSAGTTIAELERNLKINEEVIKFLTVKYSNTREMTQFKKLVELANKKSEIVEEPKPEVVEESAPAEETVTPEVALEATPEVASEATPEVAQEKTEA